MTVPSVISKVSGTTTSDTSSQKIILPGNIQSGDMLFVAFAANKDVTVTWDNSAAGAFTSLFSLLKGTTALGQGYWKIANGTESSLTLSIATSLSVGAAWTAFRIQNHNSAIEATTTGNTTGTTVPPVGLAPTWGSKDVLWLSGVLFNGTSGVPTAPDTYSSTFTVAGTGTSRATLATVEKGSVSTLSESITSIAWAIGGNAPKVMFLVGIQGIVATGLSLTLVSDDNKVYSAENDSNVIGTGLSAGVSVTYKGIGCTVLSASSSTSIKVTFPDFFTNNIKIGAAHEFKVVG